MAKVFGSSLPKKIQRTKVPTAEKLEGNQGGGAGPDDTGWGGAVLNARLRGLGFIL